MHQGHMSRIMILSSYLQIDIDQTQFQVHVIINTFLLSDNY